jgi:hypothetical protein
MERDGSLSDVKGVVSANRQLTASASLIWRRHLSRSRGAEHKALADQLDHERKLAALARRKMVDTGLISSMISPQGIQSTSAFLASRPSERALSADPARWAATRPPGTSMLKPLRPAAMAVVLYGPDGRDKRPAPGLRCVPASTADCSARPVAEPAGNPCREGPVIRP